LSCCKRSLNMICSVTNLRSPTVVVSLAILVIGGCGGPSTSRAYNHLVAASEAIKSGNKEVAFSELSASIDTSPNAWAYFERARLNLEKGDEEAAKVDCQKGLALDPTYPDLLWLSGELKKPAPQRFKGKLAKPPGGRHKGP
jgi:hypothetical protein